MMSLDQTIVNFFLRKGYSKEQARGIAAGIHAESRSDPDVRGGYKGRAVGIGQWLGPRRKALFARYGENPTKAQQLEFLHSELQGGDHGGAKVLAKKTASQVLRSYITDFMRPAAGRETNGDIRRGHAALGLKGGDRASRSGGSTYDRVQASRQEPSAPSIQKVYDAYRSGKMDPRDAAQFEHDVNSGALMLPRGSALKTRPAAPVLPAGVVKAYNSREMSDEDRAAVDADLREGVFALPRGAKLQRPADRTTGEMIGMGARNLLQGAGSLLDVVGAPVNQTINLATGANLSAQPFRDLGAAASDAIGLASPETDSERLHAAIQEGGAQGLLTAGAGVAASGARGAVGAIGRAAAAAPVVDTASSAVSGGASELARQNGAGAIGQIAAGLVAPAGAMAAGRGVAKATSSTVARLGRRAGSPVAEIVADKPRAALIDEAGNLTDDGAELATQNGVTPKELRQALDPQADEAVPVVAADEVTPPARAPNDPTADPVVARQAERAAPYEGPVPEGAAERVAQGREVGIDYTRGQATKNFDVQDAEQRLLASNGPQAEQMRQFRQQQTEQINSAVENLRSAFGSTADTATDRGQVVKDAIRNLRDQGAAGVSRLYTQAAELGGDNLGLITDDIKARVQDVQIDEAVASTIKRKLDQELARYGLVGKSEAPNELGITTTKLDDGSTVSFRGQTEPLTVANAENLRQSINKLWKQDDTGSLGPIKAAIDDAVEEALESAAARGDQTGAVGDAYKAARAAHVEQKQTFANKDVVQQIIDWKKGTRNSEAINPEQVFDKIFAGGKEGVTNLKKVKGILLSSKTPTSAAAWRGIQAHGLATIFDNAIQRSSNAAGEVAEVVSGAKLRTSISRFGPEKLKVLLDPSEYNQVMKLRRVIEDVTIPIAGTTNPSGSGNLIMRLLGNVDATVQGAFAAAGALAAGPVGAAGGAGVGRVVAGAISDAKQAKQATQTVRGAVEYDPAAAMVDDARANAAPASGVADKVRSAGATTIKAFIETYGSPRIIAPVIAAVTPTEDD